MGGGGDVVNGYTSSFLLFGGGMVGFPMAYRAVNCGRAWRCTAARLAFWYMAMVGFVLSYHTMYTPRASTGVV